MTAPNSPSDTTLNEGWFLNALSVAMRFRPTVDASCTPAWVHLQQTATRLVARWPETDRIEAEAAVLHDVLQGGRVLPDHLRGFGIPHPAIEIVERLTPRWDSPYYRWITRVCDHGKTPDLRILLAANLDRADPERGYPGPMRDTARVAVQALESAMARPPALASVNRAKAADSWRSLLPSGGFGAAGAVKKSDARGRPQ